jgi:phosphatidylserine/phosphatidylglycerophosphate/cardiolipin synthase-like enzyme
MDEIAMCTQLQRQRECERLHDTRAGLLQLNYRCYWTGTECRERGDQPWSGNVPLQNLSKVSKDTFGAMALTPAPRTCSVDTRFLFDTTAYFKSLADHLTNLAKGDSVVTTAVFIGWMFDFQTTLDPDASGQTITLRLDSKQSISFGAGTLGWYVTQAALGIAQRRTQDAKGESNELLAFIFWTSSVTRKTDRIGMLLDSGLFDVKLNIRTLACINEFAWSEHGVTGATQGPVYALMQNPHVSGITHGFPSSHQKSVIFAKLAEGGQVTAAKVFVGGVDIVDSRTDGRIIKTAEDPEAEQNTLKELPKDNGTASLVGTVDGIFEDVKDERTLKARLKSFAMKLNGKRHSVSKAITEYIEKRKEQLKNKRYLGWKRNEALSRKKKGAFFPALWEDKVLLFKDDMAVALDVAVIAVQRWQRELQFRGKSILLDTELRLTGGNQLRRIFEELSNASARSLKQSNASSSARTNVCQVQMTASRGFYLVPEASPVTAALDGYIRAIHQAENFVYIEDQFFSSATEPSDDGDNGYPSNQVMHALLLRVQRSLLENKRFNVVILTPLFNDMNSFYSTLRALFHSKYGLIARVRALVKMWNVRVDGMERSQQKAVKESMQVGRRELRWTDILVTAYLARASCVDDVDITGKVTQGYAPGVMKLKQAAEEEGAQLCNYEFSTVYIHSKMLVCDKKDGQGLLIVGSANVNDRSLSGVSDQEGGVIVDGPAGIAVFEKAMFEHASLRVSWNTTNDFHVSRVAEKLHEAMEQNRKTVRAFSCFDPKAGTFNPNDPRCTGRHATMNRLTDKWVSEWNVGLWDKQTSKMFNRKPAPALNNSRFTDRVFNVSNEHFAIVGPGTEPLSFQVYHAPGEEHHGDVLRHFFPFLPGTIGIPDEDENAFHFPVSAFFNRFVSAHTFMGFKTNVAGAV